MGVWFGRYFDKLVYRPVSSWARSSRPLSPLLSSPERSRRKNRPTPVAPLTEKFQRLEKALNGSLKLPSSSTFAVDLLHAPGFLGDAAIASIVPSSSLLLSLENSARPSLSLLVVPSAGFDHLCSPILSLSLSLSLSLRCVYMCTAKVSKLRGFYSETLRTIGNLAG